MAESVVNGMMRKLFGKDIDYVANGKFDGSNDESKISMEVLYELPNVDNVDNGSKVFSGTDLMHAGVTMNDEIALNRSKEMCASLVAFEGNNVKEDDVNQSSSLPYTPVICCDVPCRIVESSVHDITSTRYITNVTLCSNDANDGKEQEKHEQENARVKYSSLEVIRKALADQRAQELRRKGELNTKLLLNRIRTNAFHLLLDVGWNVERWKRLRTRPERATPNQLVSDCLCKSPKGRVHNRLAKAWVSCGEELHAKLLNPQYDEIGKQWVNKHEFYVDMVHTMAFIEKEEKTLSHILRWQLLDPFMAVVCIDRKVNSLGIEGVALKAVNSKTSIVEINSFFPGEPSLSIVPVSNSEGKYEYFESDPLMCPEVVHNQSTSLKSIARSRGKEFSKTTNLKHPKHNSSAKKLEAESQASKNVASIHKYSHKKMRIDHPKENDMQKISTNEVSIRESNVRRVLNFNEIDKPDNANTEIQEDEANDVIQQNVVLSEDASNLFIINQTFVHSMQQQVVYLYSLQESPFFNGAQEVSVQQLVQPSFINIQQSVQPLLYHVNQGDYMQQAVHPFLYQPIIRGVNMQQQLQPFLYQPGIAENISFHDNLNCNEASSSKKLENHKQKKTRKKSKKLSEIEATEVNLSNENNHKPFGHDVYDANIKCINFSAHQEKSIKSKISNQKESSKISNDKAWRMVIEDSFCFMEEDIPIKKTYKRRAKSETLPFKRNNKHKKDEFDREQEDAPPASTGIIFESCKNGDSDLLISAMVKSKDSKIRFSPSKYYRKRKNRTRNSDKPSVQTNENCDTKESKTILCWLIDKGVISLNETMQSINSKNNTLQKEGIVKRNGILCKCCDKMFCVSNFKFHACRERNLFSFLFLGYKKTYTLCQLEAWSAEYKERKRGIKMFGKEYSDQNDDACALCGDGGDLVCCDGCPSSYHKSCLPYEDLPEGSWFCHHCTCSICGEAIRAMEPLTSPIVLTCQQCEQKYHKTCIEGKPLLKEEVGSNSWFCGVGCQKVHVALHSRVGEMTSIGDGFYHTTLRCNHGEQKFSSPQKIATTAECHAKLAVALTVVEESFIPMVDSRTGIQVIPHIVYNWGSNFARLNYQGFYTMVLERDDELICVASIRVHGVTVAEIPLIATCNEYRRQGMCRRLMGAIEELLKSLKVELLVLSAVPQLVDTWMSGFGYKHMKSNEKKRLNNVNLMSFPGTVLLQKTLYEGTLTKMDTAQDYVNSDARTPIETLLKDNEQETLNPPVMTLLKDNEQETLNLPVMNQLRLSEQSQLETADSSDVKQSLTTEQVLIKTSPKNGHFDPENSECKANCIGCESNSQEKCDMKQLCSTEKSLAEVLKVSSSSDMIPLPLSSEQTLIQFFSCSSDMNQSHSAWNAIEDTDRKMGNECIVSEDKTTNIRERE